MKENNSQNTKREYLIRLYLPIRIIYLNIKSFSSLRRVCVYVCHMAQNDRKLKIFFFFAFLVGSVWQI